MKKAIVMAAFSLLVSGCFKMTFVQGTPPVDNSLVVGTWHQGGIFGLVEFSRPLNPQTKCNGNDWEAVKTRQTFIQGLLGRLTYSLYTPWKTEVVCK